MLKRTTPLLRGKPMAKGSGPKRRTPMKRSNPKRKRERFERAYLSPAYVAFIHSLECAVGSCRNAAECAHVRSRAAGGRWDEIAPLCPVHHRESHAMGLQSFQHRYGFDLCNVAHATALRWLAWTKDG